MTAPDPAAFRIDALFPDDVRWVHQRNSHGIRNEHAFAGETKVGEVSRRSKPPHTLCFATLFERPGHPGWRVEYHEDGSPMYAAPHVNGRMHGVTGHWTPGGLLLSACRFIDGTGVDYWCLSQTGELAEEWPYVQGKQHGWERWWSGGEVWQARHWVHDVMHGPRYTEGDDNAVVELFIDGKEVDRETYEAARIDDPSLPAVQPKAYLGKHPIPSGFHRLIDRPWFEG